MHDTVLAPAEIHDLSVLAGLMIPADDGFGVPGADDPAIFGDILRSLDRDLPDVRIALARYADLCRSAFPSPEAAANTLLAQGDPTVRTLGRVILQCYYRDDRVIRALGLEPRPPFPKGHTLEQGDWSLLDPVRNRPKMWRDAP